MCRLSLPLTDSNDDIFWSANYYRSMASNLWTLRQQNLYCDLEIESDDGIVINAHRIIVAAGVEYFRQMLSSNMAESFSKKVKLNCVSYEAITQILNFVYTGNICLDSKNIFEVTRAADFLLVEPVKAICLNFLLTNIDLDNCFPIKLLSYEISSDKLSTAVDDFVLNNFDQLHTNQNIGVYDYETFAQLLFTDNLRTRNEMQVFDGIIKWVEYDFEDRIELLPSLLKYVRFLFISRDELKAISQNSYVIGSAHASKLVFEVIHYLDCNENLNYSHSTIESAILTKQRPKDSRFLPLNRFYSSGVLICLGGRHESLIPCDFVETYSQHTNQWLYNLELPIAGRQVGITVIGTNVYLIGGYNGRGQSLPSGMLDAKTGKYELIPQMPLIRRGCAVSQFGGKFVFALGGTDSGKYAAFADVQCFDIENQSWDFVEPMLTGRRNLTSVTLGSYIYAIGGCFGEESLCVNTIERYSIVENRWEALIDMKIGRYSCGAAVLGNRIYIIGGFGFDAEKNSAIPLDNCVYFDTETGDWHDVSPLQTARGASAVVSMGGRLYSIGGFNGQYLNSVETYDPITDCWTYCESIQGPRSGSGACHINALPNELFIN